VPRIAEVMSLAEWLRTPTAAAGAHRFVLSLRDAGPFQMPPTARTMVFLSGPEGGLSPVEETAARAAGFTPVSLGPRVLRADTAPLAVLAAIGMSAAGRC
jgi:16S rRNA (uracil1498-N3)-methyltransferase